MNDFPWGVTIGLSIVLAGTIAIIVYILMLDYLEERNKRDETKDETDH